MELVFVTVLVICKLNNNNHHFTLRRPCCLHSLSHNHQKSKWMLTVPIVLRRSSTATTTAQWRTTPAPRPPSTRATESPGSYTSGTRPSSFTPSTGAICRSVSHPYSPIFIEWSLYQNDVLSYSARNIDIKNGFIETIPKAPFVSEPYIP